MINKKYIKYILVFGLTVLSLSSCLKEDFHPTDTIDPSKAFRNASDINLGLIGVYAYIDNSMSAISSTVADENMFPTENTVGNSDAFRWLYNSGSGSVTSLYNTNYVAIDRVNRVLAAVNSLSFTGADVALAARYKGELLTLRAYLHFELLRAYASSYQTGALGVPYMEVSTISYPARDSFEAVIAKVKTDLTTAKALIPANFTDKTRITRTAISAIQARVALYEKNWPEAITYSTEVIAAIPLATSAQFPGLWTDANDSEVIWKLKRVGTTDSRIGDFYFRQTGGIVLYAPSFELISEFDIVKDLRYPAYIKFDATRTGIKSQYLVNKFIGGTTTAPGLTDIKLFRTGEMYLIRAEARAESVGDAAGDINALRSVRITGYTNATFADKAALIDAVYRERFKELAFEGHRFFDLKRRNYSITRIPADAVNASGAISLVPTQAQYNLPLPALEISVNKNTVQNPNY